MATSGTYTFSVNRDQIIRDALINIRKLDEIETPTAQQITDCGFKLNMICKQWMGRGDFAPGLKTWTRRRGHLFLSNSTGQYTLGPNGTGWTTSYSQTAVASNAVAGQPVVNVVSATGLATGQKFGVQTGRSLQWSVILSVIGNAVTLQDNLLAQANANAPVYTYATTAQQPVHIEAVVLREDDNTDSPVDIFRDVKEYDALPSKADVDNEGDPTAIYYEFQLGNSFLYTDVAACEDVSKHLVITYLEAIQDFNNPLDEPEYPQEYYLALCWELAKQIAPSYGATWSPLMEANYQTALVIAKKKEPIYESAYFMSAE